MWISGVGESGKSKDGVGKEEMKEKKKDCCVCVWVWGGGGGGGGGGTELGRGPEGSFALSSVFAARTQWKVL